MKNIYLTLSIVFGSLSLSAQNTFPASGNAGIGTNTPASRLTIKQAGTGISMEPGGNPYYGTLGFNRESGTGVIFDPTGNAFQINNGSTDKNLHIQVYNGLGQLITNNALVISANGSVGIGTAAPQEMLSVNGTIRSREVKVETANWPDYVFKPTYKLKPLIEVKAYIDQNHHLPEVPSAQDVLKMGVNLGEMNKLLMKKVEELTLYLIENDKTLRKLQAEVSQFTKPVTRSIHKKNVIRHP